MPTEPRNDSSVYVADVVAVDAHLARGHVVDAGHQQRAGGLARTRRAHQGDELTRGDGEAHVAQDPGALVVEIGRARGLLQRRDRRHRGRRVAEPHVVELDPADRLEEVDRAGTVRDQRREVEHLEDPLERDQRGQHVDARVGQLRERLVDLADVHRERGDGADADGAGDRQVAADEVDDRGADGGDETEGGEQHPRVHRGLHADVAHAPGAVGEGLGLAAMLAEQLDDERAADVEALGDRVVHRRVELHALAGQPLQLRTHPLGRDDEERQDDERQDR